MVLRGPFLALNCGERGLTELAIPLKLDELCDHGRFKWTGHSAVLLFIALLRILGDRKAMCLTWTAFIEEGRNIDC